MDAKTYILDFLTDASGVTIDSKVVFDLGESQGIGDIIKNSLIKEKLMSNPELLLKKSNTIYMYDNTVIDIKVGDKIRFQHYDSLEAFLMPCHKYKKAAQLFWPFMVCKAIIRASKEKANFRSHYAVLEHLAAKYNMTVSELVSTNPLKLIPREKLQKILSKRTINLLAMRMS